VCPERGNSRDPEKVALAVAVDMHQ
jgi:hypothetical protein